MKGSMLKRLGSCWISPTGLTSLVNRGFSKPNKLLQGANQAFMSTSQHPSDPQKVFGSSQALAKQISDPKDTLLSPVYIPEDGLAVLKERHPAARILANSALIIQRELEMMNLMIGFEQANKYVIMDAKGTHLGFMAEEELGFGNALARQWFRTHRSFKTHIFDRDMNEVLRFFRPFSWISSRIRVFDPLESTSPLSNSIAVDLRREQTQVPNKPLSEMRIIGEAQQQWSPLRRKYNLFLFRPQSSQRLESSNQEPPEMAYDQFAYVNEPFLSWDFSLLSSSSQLIGSVNRNFAGFGREIFTDTGVYALRMDAAALAEEPSHLISKTGKSGTVYGPDSGGMSLDQRAIMLATAVSIDFDYFTRQRGGVLGGMFPFWAVGGEAAEAGAAGSVGGTAAGGAGSDAAVGAASGVARTGAGAAGAGEGAIAGAGTMAGYESMREGWGRNKDGSTSVTNQDVSSAPEENELRQSPAPGDQSEEFWGNEDNDDEGGDGSDDSDWF